MTGSAYGTGEQVTIPAPVGGVVSGKPLVVGSLFLIPVTTENEGDLFAGYCVGEHILGANPPDTAGFGDAAYFDPISGDIRPSAAAGRYFIGHFTKEKLATDTVAHVRLNGSVERQAL